MHSGNLAGIASAKYDIEPEFVQVRRFRHCRAGKLGQGVQGGPVDGKESCIKNPKQQKGGRMAPSKMEPAEGEARLAGHDGQDWEHMLMRQQIITSTRSQGSVILYPFCRAP